jgi:hypothetical protein
MGFRKNEAGGEEAPTFSDQAATDHQGLRMVGVIVVQQGKVRRRINKDASCLGCTASPHACLQCRYVSARY